MWTEYSVHVQAYEVLKENKKDITCQQSCVLIMKKQYHITKITPFITISFWDEIDNFLDKTF